MRLRSVSACLLLLISGLLLAQVPVGVGPGAAAGILGIMDTFDWYLGTGAGCSNSQGRSGFPQNASVCAGALLSGDTPYFTAWLADSSLLPIASGLPIVGTFNDYTMKTCSGNIGISQLAEFNWSSRNAGRMYDVNCMSSMNGADSPSGWLGKCTSSDTTYQGCVWHSRQVFVRNNVLYLPIFRTQPSGAAFQTHDMTILRSADGGKTWQNPYTFYNSGAARADGDGPKCDAASVASACTNAAYLDNTHSSVMWKAETAHYLTSWEPIFYGQDGNMPTGVVDGCDPNTYVCFVGGEAEGTLARVPLSSIQDPATWQYYTCPAITDTYVCPGGDSASWSSNEANMTMVIRPKNYSFFTMTYLKDFKAYVYGGVYLYKSGFSGDSWFMGQGYGGEMLLTAPTPQGPWTEVMANPRNQGWTTLLPIPALGYSVLGSDPPHIRIPGLSVNTLHGSQGTTYFSLWDLIPGKSSLHQGGEKPLDIIVANGGIQLHSGIVASDSHAPGSIPRKGLEWAFDMYDKGGDLSRTDTPFVGRGFNDLMGQAFLQPNGTWGSNGLTLQSWGVSLANEYAPHLTSMSHSSPATGGSYGAFVEKNVPVGLQGNGTFSIAGVFRYDGGTYGNPSIWMIGNGNPTTSVAVSCDVGGANLEIGWGGKGMNRWRFNSGFTLTTGNWYFITATVQANGDTPIAHLWVGVGGMLLDKVAGVTYASTGGTPTKTPNVSGSPLVLNTVDPNQGNRGFLSYAGLFVYSRALGQAEVGLVYNTMKAKMLARGVILQ